MEINYRNGSGLEKDFVSVALPNFGPKVGVRG
jgi:hypothetical protein